MAFSIKTQICFLILLIVTGLSSKSSIAHECGHHQSGSSASPVHEIAANHHSDHGHHHHHHHCGHSHHHDAAETETESRRKLPEEIAEEEDLKNFGFGLQYGHDHDHDHDHHHGDDYRDLELNGVGLWINAMGCSLLVSFASLICLIILPVIFINGQPSKAVVDSLAIFGAGAMLGDAFLHQLPHAFGGEHSHSHDHDHDGSNDDHSHSHSMKDLSVGLSVLFGIVVFLVVEKIVRYVQENSTNANKLSHGHHHHHHHHHKSSKKKDDKDNEHEDARKNITPSEGEAIVEEQSDISLNSDDQINSEPHLRKRTGTSAREENNVSDKSNDTTPSTEHLDVKESSVANSNIVFGYLNLFSDGVHNFTDGIALGSAFLLYGSVGGWSRTLFLLAHELPQEIGDFGILVRSGFSVGKALFFNFLSALVALVGTALALVMGQDPGQSSLIEGFTAGGFIYIAVAGVLSEMNSDKVTLRGTVTQLISLILGIAVALCISLVE